ncbi:MAG: tetratricopeptide repeat-containing sensor histidine kinase [Balneolaceae bacterium]|nr:tetratricopeptide repeat-containing sensor histidine kinase [Balneolaceae bacterium]
MELRRLFLTLFFLAAAPAALWAQDSISALEDSLRAASPDTQRVKLMLELVPRYAEAGRYGEARSRLERADSLSEALGYDYGRAGVMAARGNLLLLRQQVDSARVVLEEANRQFSGQRNRDRIVNLLGSAYRYLGRWEEALEHYRLALSLTDTLHQKVRASRIRMNMAAVHEERGEMSTAYRYYLQGLQQAEASGDSTYLAVVLNNVGEAYTSDGQPEEGLYYLERSWELAERLGYTYARLLSANNIANAYTELGNADEALAWYERALELHPRVRSTPPYQIQYNMGNLYGQMGELDRSEELFSASLASAREAGVMQGIYYNSIGLGRVTWERGNHAAASDRFGEALDAADSLGSPPFMQNAHHWLYRTRKAMGDYDSALTHLEESTFWADSLDRVRQENLLAETRTRMGLRQQEELNEALRQTQAEQEARLQFQNWLIAAGVAIVLLLGALALILYRSSRQRERLNRQLEQRGEELEELNRIKDKLLSVVAHDLRNPITALRGMLHFYRDRDFDREQLDEMAEELEGSLEQNLNTMENLLAWALSQMGGLTVRAEEVALDGMAEELVTSQGFQAERKGIALERQVDPDCVAEADPDMTRVVLRNLLNNAVKFSGEGDRVTLRGGRANGEVVVEVSDTGVGIPKEDREGMFDYNMKHRQGTWSEKGSGLGLSICREFVGLQGGRISFDTEIGRGTTFRVVLPAATGKASGGEKADAAPGEGDRNG